MDKYMGRPSFKLFGFEIDEPCSLGTQQHTFNQSRKMCFVCRRLGLSDDVNEGWSPDQAHDKEEEEVDVPQPQRPRRQMARRSPRRETVVETAPSHDNKPSFAAYSVLEGTEPADFMKQRAPYGLCVYDVTPDANPTRAEKMARSIFERTMAYRRSAENEEDRVEVVAAPLPSVGEPSVTAERELAEHCIRHFENERARRLVMGNAAMARSWYLPELLNDSWYNMGILIISRMTARWEEGLDWKDRHPEAESPVITRETAYSSRFGACLLVKWQPRESIWRAWDEPVTPESRVSVTAHSVEKLRAAAQGLYGPGARMFYEHFVSDGILDMELAAARNKGS